MTAIVYQGARFANASTAGVTQPDLTAPGTPFGQNVISQAQQAVAGITPLEDFLGGGIHPENAVGTAVSTAVPRATDSVRGAFGGLKPKMGSTVGPGPAGSAAQARTSFASALRSLFSSAPSTPKQGQVPATSGGGPIEKPPGLPTGFG